MRIIPGRATRKTTRPAGQGGAHRRKVNEKMAKDKYYGKTLRKNFARHEEVMPMPNLLEIQKKSYQEFLDTGLREVFNDVGAITDYQGNLELTFIDYNLPEKDVEFAVQTGRAVMLRNVRDGMEPRDGMISWDRRIRYLRKRGVNAPIYATAGITCGASLLEAKQAGASGAFVGSCLMNLWDDEPAMLALLADLEQAANS